MTALCIEQSEEGLSGRRYLDMSLLEPSEHAIADTAFASPRENASIYSILGGTPRYLAALDSGKSVEANVVELLLSPRGEVRQLVETALDQEEGLREISSYKAILRAVAGGRTSRNEIAQQSGLANDTPLREKLERLVGLGYLNMRVNINAKSNEPKRYYLADQAMRFHQRFVEPNLSLLAREDPETVWRAAVEEELPAFIGLEFERIAVQGYDRIRAKRGLPLVKEWGRWEGRDAARQSLEIDIVAPLVGEGVLTGAVKWNRRPVSIDLHLAHVQMLERAARSGRRWAHEALEAASPLLYVSAAGFEEGFQEFAERGGHGVIALSLKDLYES